MEYLGQRTQSYSGLSMAVYRRQLRAQWRRLMRRTNPLVVCSPACLQKFFRKCSVAEEVFEWGIRILA